MLEALSLTAAWMSSLTGFSILALAQDRHWEAVTGMAADRRRHGAHLRVVGGALQCAACALTVPSQGMAFGILLWAIAMTAAAMLIAFTLAWRPHWMAGVARVCRKWPGRL